MNHTADVNDFIPHSYNAGFIVLSYLVSLAGCWTTLELLHRRTGSRGYYNWYLLLSAATTMGAVAIWCMHYIGNRAVIMDEGQADLQIQYSPGSTAGSFFLPIFVIAGAFWFFNMSESVNRIKTLIGGFLTGSAVCGMHYMGQGGISNYKCHYIVLYVFGSAIISITATTIALGIFFYFHSTWTDSWWKRAFCASLLAVAVSGMHWTGTAGTMYRKRKNVIQSVSGLSREATVEVVICLSVGCCIILIAFAVIGQRSRQLSADRAQQVVLACATFDDDGKLMVTPQGLLPCRKITESYVERSFEDVFDVSHDVFCWIFRASRCWQTIAEILPSMDAHVRSNMPTKARRQSKVSDSRATNSMGNTGDYSILFRELFCLAARDLAEQIQEPLENLGVLFGSIMSTGTLSHTAKLKIRGLQLKRDAMDVEKGDSVTSSTLSLDLFGRGQLLFVVRQANAAESARLIANGHRFATISNVVEHMARSMEVRAAELYPQLEKMQAASLGDQDLKPGVHFACFALRPLWHRGWDVLVRKNAHCLLPSSFLTPSNLTTWQLDVLQRMDNLTSVDCITFLRGEQALENDEHEFVSALLDAIKQLSRCIDDPLFDEARLVARPLLAPSSHYSIPNDDETYLINFRVNVDVHRLSLLNARYEFASSKFFLCSQHAYKGCPDNLIFASTIHREFGALAVPKTRTSVISNRRSRNSRNLSADSDILYECEPTPSPQKKRTWPARLGFGVSAVRDDSSSEKNLVHLAGPIRPYGGIHVSNVVEVDGSELRHGNIGPGEPLGIEMKELGNNAEAGPGDVEKKSFADELFTMLVNESKKERASRYQSS